METHIVIMAGGIGSRFWPMSTPECPKQFIDVTGCGKSLIQLTVERFQGLCIPDNIWIVTSDKYKETVRKQLPSVPPHHILTEPVARNTAPCITYACWKIKKHHPHANIVVTPADALVINTDEFRRVIAKALLMTDQSKAIVTIGIRPCRPETGYGYIAAGEEVDQDIRKVDEFKETGLENGTALCGRRELFLECRDLCMECKDHRRGYTPLCTGHCRGVRQDLSGVLYRKRERNHRRAVPCL